MEGPEIKAVEAVIDNGSFGKRTLRFETGRLAQQADGAVAAYLDDDSMILSTTTAGSSPKENYDFFPDRGRGREDVRRRQDPGIVLPP